MFWSRSLRPVVNCVLIPIAMTAGPPAAADATMAPEWVEKWREDLEVAHEALRDKHPSPFDFVSAEDLAAEFEQLAERLPDLDHHDVIVELTRIVARLEDGHTRLTLPLAPGVDFMQGHSETETPALPAMLFHQYPLRFAIDSEGPWIEATTPDRSRILGGRLVAIDGMPVQDVLDRVRPTIRADNEMQTLHHLPMHLVLAELLEATGVTGSAEQGTFTIEFANGSHEVVSLEPLPEDSAVDWVSAGSRGESVALAGRHNDENFWFAFVEPLDLVYLQFNTVYDSDDETIRQFADRLSAMLELRPEAQLVIDLRRNRGGDQSLALPLLHAVIACPQNRAGRLFTIIGRATFSAAMNFALHLEKHTQTLFVGEPTGSKPNHYGDSRKTVLPNSNVTLRISSLYWQWNPTDDRNWIPPYIDARPTLEAALAGVDPAMEAIASITGSRGQGEIAGEWRGNLPPARFGRDTVLRVASPADGLEADVDIPAFGLAKGPIEKLEIDEAGGVTFDLPVGKETIRYQGTLAGDWLVGYGELGSIRFPFLLKRSVSP